MNDITCLDCIDYYSKGCLLTEKNNFCFKLATVDNLKKILLINNPIGILGKMVEKNIHDKIKLILRLEERGDDQQ